VYRPHLPLLHERPGPQRPEKGAVRLRELHEGERAERCSLRTKVPDIMARTSRISDYGLEFIVDSIIMLQYVEIESAISRSINVLKMRGSGQTWP